MKKLLLIISALALLAACSKKNEVKPIKPNTVTAANLTGKWLMITDTSYVVGDTSSSTISVSNIQEYFNYNQDGSGTETAAVLSFAINFKYTVAGGVIKVVIDGEEDDLQLLAYSSTRYVIREYSPDEKSYVDEAFVKQ